VPLLAPYDEGLQVMQAWTSGVKPTLIAADCACLWLTPEPCTQTVAAIRCHSPFAGWLSHGDRDASPGVMSASRSHQQQSSGRTNTACLLEPNRLCAHITTTCPRRINRADLCPAMLFAACTNGHRDGSQILWHAHHSCCCPDVFCPL